MNQRAKVTLMCAAAMVAGLCWASQADAHIRVGYPPTRYQFEPPNSDNQKIGPCAAGAPTGIVTALTSGQDITVTWDEFIDHSGHFRVALDTTGTDAFVDPASETDMAVTGNVVAYVPDGGGSAFSHTFTLPDVECASCTLQIMQVMTDKLPWGPANGSDIYYWCSDISLTRESGTGGTPSTATGAGGAGAGTGTGAGPDDDETAEGGGCAISPGSIRNGTRTGFVLVVAFFLLFLRRRVHRRRLGMAAISLLCLACGGAQTASDAGGAARPTGANAADFTLNTLDGGRVTLSDYEGDKVVLVDFWATNCEPCKAEMPEIVKLYDEKRAAGLEVLAVSIDGPGTQAALSSYVRRFNMRFPVLLDPETEVFDRYSPKGTMPYTAVIDRDGVIVLRRSGYQAGDEASWKQLVEAIDSTLGR